MSTQKLNIHEAKTKLSAVLAQIEKTGETFIICRKGKPVAELVPFRSRSGGRLKKHAVMGQIEIRYDPIEELSDDEWGQIE